MRRVSDVRPVALLVATVSCTSAMPPSSPAPAPGPVPPSLSEQSVSAAEGPPAVAAPSSAPPSRDPGPLVVASQRGWLGVQLRANMTGGVLVESVLPQSPAEMAGLQAGDLVTGVDGFPTNSPRELVRIVAARRAGEEIALAYRRDGQQRLTRSRLERRPSTTELLRRTYLGRPAPELDGTETVQGAITPRLKPLRGRVVLLEFWAGWCGACRAMAPVLNRWHHDLGAQGLTVVGVTAAPVARASIDARGFGIDYSVLADPDADATRQFQAMALPTLFLVDREGVVRDVMVGYSGAGLRRLRLRIDALLDSRG